MKVEKINENKIKITLSFEELEKRDISLKDLEKDSMKAKDLFLNLIEESNLDEDFIIDDSQLFIEAFSDNNNTFVVTITKIENNIPDILKYKSDTLNFKLKSKFKNNISYRVDSNIYMFESIEQIFKLCEDSKSENLFFGRNYLYKLNNKYFLIFNKSSVKNNKFLKTFIFLSEYCSAYYKDNIYELSIKEKATEILKTSALQKLSKIC